MIATRLRTLLVRRCCECRGLLGLRLARWQGGLVAESHGLCGACTVRELRATGAG